jgi:hypothetical protein
VRTRKASSRVLVELCSSNPGRENLAELWAFLAFGHRLKVEREADELLTLRRAVALGWLAGLAAAP